MFTRPRPHRANDARAAPTVLAPDQPKSSAEHGQVHELDRWAILDRHNAAAAGTVRPRLAGFDMHSDRLTDHFSHRQHIHIGGVRQQLAHARSVHLDKGSFASLQMVRALPVDFINGERMKSLPKLWIF